MKEWNRDILEGGDLGHRSRHERREKVKKHEIEECQHGNGRTFGRRDD